ncbi:WxL domain-containing protein [Enterococcus faecalis]|nr:WxL domain-containing protein [Enterococcus faecalis]
MKKILLTSVVTVSVLGSVMGGVVSHAAEADNKSSNGNVGFKTPEDGALKLLEVADLNFGDHEISGSDENYKTETDTKATVQDLRGTETGWELRVSQSGQFMNGEKELTNAQITLDSPELDASSTATANVKTGVILNPNGDSAVILDAAKGQGNGIATENFKTGNATLSVPGKTTKITGQYTTTLTWTLMDGVGNE